MAAFSFSKLGASASDFVPYAPFFKQQTTNSIQTTWRPYSDQDSRWQPLSKNQRRKQNKRNPPQQSTFLPPTAADLVIPAPPQPATFPAYDSSGYLLLWMNTYNPLINNRIDLSARRNSEFNYDGDFKGWCFDRGLGFSAACA